MLSKLAIGIILTLLTYSQVILAQDKEMIIHVNTEIEKSEKRTDAKFKSVNDKLGSVEESINYRITDLKGYIEGLNRVFFSIIGIVASVAVLYTTILFTMMRKSDRIQARAEERLEERLNLIEDRFAKQLEVIDTRLDKRLDRIEEILTKAFLS